MGTLNIPTIASDSIAWASKQAMLDWFEAITFNAATPTTNGGVYQGAAVSYSSSSVTPSYSTLNILQGDGSTVSVVVPTQADYQAVLSEVVKLQTAMNSLLSGLRTAGIIQS